MGEPTILDNVSLAVSGAAREQLLAQAAQLPDDRAEVLVAAADASAYGTRVKWTRYASGVVVGALVAGVAVYALKG